jgi:hypothetical protein
MRTFFSLIVALGCAASLGAQTAEELVDKNIQAHGGMEKIKAITSLRMTGLLQQGGIRATLTRDAVAPDLLRQTFSLQGMTAIQAYDGSTGWRVMPFGGRKEAELMGEDDLRIFKEEADFYGPLVDYQAKGNTIEYLGHDTVDGDDAYRLKVTLKNGDIYYYYLDPDTYLEIRVESQHFIRGAVRESFSEMGSYKLVNGVYYPFSIETGSKGNPHQTAKIFIDKMEANVAIDPAEFKMPPPSAESSTPKQPEPQPAKPKSPKER